MSTVDTYSHYYTIYWSCYQLLKQIPFHHCPLTKILFHLLVRAEPKHKKKNATVSFRMAVIFHFQVRFVNHKYTKLNENT